MKDIKYIVHRCANLFQGDDIAIHYTTSDDGSETLSFCPACLDKYREKTKENITPTI